LGRYGEDVACRHLIEAGLQVLERNWRCREGEIDIVARADGVLVVCEVKTRSGHHFGGAREAFTASKVRRLRRLAGLWLRAAPGRGIGAGFTDVRLDAIAVQRPGRGPAIVEHIIGVG
jgi:putative endonuclease